MYAVVNWFYYLKPLEDKFCHEAVSDCGDFTLISFFVPVIIRKVKVVRDLTWLYGVVGILLLAVVLVLAGRSGGAKLSITIGSVSFQFSEIVKITFVFFMAGMLQMETGF